MMRVAGFFMVLPIFGSQSVSMRVRGGVALLVTVFFGYIVPVPAQVVSEARPLAAALPLTWLARAMRASTLGALGPRHLVDAALLAVVGAACFAAALALMRRRLVK